jgi:hypothetical protein
MKNTLKLLVTFAAFLLSATLFAAKAEAAPRLYFDPANKTTVKGTDFQAIIKIDVENNQTFGADAVLNFPTDMTVKSVTNGGFFDDFQFSQSQGSLELHGFFSSLDEYKSGSGNFVIITFNTNKDSGTGNITFTCSGSGNDTFILDSDGDNILSCGSTNQLSLTYSGSGDGDDDDDDDGDDNSGTGGTAPTNACGGTCGSHSNCNTGLFCYQGFCRNPECGGTVSCQCAAPTPTPRPRSTARAIARTTARPTTSPTPKVITLTVSTPYPSIVPAESLAEAEDIEEKEQKAADGKKVAVILGTILLALGLILLIIKKLRGRKPGPPKVVNMTGSSATSLGESTGQDSFTPPTFDDTPYSPPPPQKNP